MTNNMQEMLRDGKKPDAILVVPKHLSRKQIRELERKWAELNKGKCPYIPIHEAS